MTSSTNKVTSTTAPGLAAAATARLASGGRNVASVRSGPIDPSGFSGQVGVSDNGLLRYQEAMEYAALQRQPTQLPATPFVMRSSSGFRAEDAEQAASAEDESPTLDRVLYGVGTYEANLRVVHPDQAKPGSQFNYLS